MLNDETKKNIYKFENKNKKWIGANAQNLS
jgi:hypothetical protein